LEGVKKMNSKNRKIFSGNGAKDILSRPKILNIFTTLCYDIFMIKRELSMGMQTKFVVMEKLKIHALTFSIIILSCISSGCLFIRPLTPSARLVQPGNLYYALSYDSTQFTSEYSTSFSTPNTVRSLQDYNLDFGLCSRLYNTPSELGLYSVGYGTYALDYKYAFSDPARDWLLSAFDLTIDISTMGNLRAGGSAGMDFDWVLNKDLPFDFVTAAYYQYFNMDSLHGPDDMSYFPTNARPYPQALFFYAGLELGAIKSCPVSLGAGYMLYLGKPDNATLDFNYNPIFLMASVKCGLLSLPDKKAPADAVTTDVKVNFYSSTASKLMQDGSYKEASQTLLNGLDRYPDDYELNLMMGNCSLKLNDKKLSYFYLKKALAARPDDTQLSSQTAKLAQEILNGK
jgi:hypothetical protein